MDLDLEKLSSSEEVEEPGWFDIIPYELRSKIIDLMDTKSKCRFAICSKKCNEEVEMSRDQIEFMEISIFDTICVKSKDISRNIHFSQRSAKKWYVKCEDLRSKRIIWKNKEVGMWRDVVLKYFDHFVKTGANSLKELKICTSLLDANNYDKSRSIKHLKNLESIRLPREFDLDFEFCSFEQICRMKKKVDLRIPTLSIDQIFQIKAKNIEIGGLKWTIPEINTFLKRCIDGDLNTKVQYLSLSFDEFMRDKKILEDLKIYAQREKEHQFEYLFDYKNEPYLGLAVDLPKHSDQINVCTRLNKYDPFGGDDFSD